MKIIQAINKIIENSDDIKNIVYYNGADEFFFEYRIALVMPIGAYKFYRFSVKCYGKDEYAVYYYSEDLSPQDICHYKYYSNDKLMFVSYYSNELKTKESLETFRDLYNIVKDKYYGASIAFDDIINN
jgi:hypothetical protein